MIIVCGGETFYAGKINENSLSELSHQENLFYNFNYIDHANLAGLHKTSRVTFWN